ncbi:N-acetylmuramoyl-L-alanine amidase [Rhizobium lusitanum]|uniref:N-acetylmuramoyl-L-alanine amidase n=1 Tax=Rhizobium lusitanum TaxID=293958 RepID=A0A1C3XAK5_9HYPH|nr:N-acetylmuramoyl-L-alanine amidase [Rhizobium lusitanum]
MTAAYGAWYSRRLPLRRLYPVNTSTLTCVVCFICHNSKGKAKYAIILMDSSDDENEGGRLLILLPAYRRAAPSRHTWFPLWDFKNNVETNMGRVGHVLKGLRHAAETGVRALRLAMATFALMMLAAFLPFAATNAAADPVLAFGARIAGDDARTRIVIDMDREPTFSVHYLDNPVRVVVDLPATAFGFPAADLKAAGLFKDIRYGTMDADSARIVLTAKKPVKLVMAKVQANEDGKGSRLVLDAEMLPAEQFTELVKEQSWTSDDTAKDVGPVESTQKADPNTFLVAVDAGHGGIDAGATGSDGVTQEKDITLAFAKMFADKLNAQPGIKAFLVRDKDQYLSLSERVTIARQNHASLFISLHADTLKQKDIRGATVYTISDKASDRLAGEVADRENNSDQIAAADTQAQPPAVTDILMDLTRRETQAFSISLAQDVLSSFNGQVSTINNPHRHAGFRVLQAPDVPSILLELGFLSNKDDEKLLLDLDWRQKVADRLTEAVKQYRVSIIANGG